MLVVLGFVFIVFLIGVIVGWAWKPMWVSFGNCTFDDGLQVKNRLLGSNPNPKPNLNPNPQLIQVGTSFGFWSSQMDRITANQNRSSSPVGKREEENVVSENDLKHLWHLVEKRDGGGPWKHMMDKSTSTMTFQAWQRDPKNGPPQFCSITIYEDATPELLRDFFWEDDLRLKWDDMLLNATTLQEFRITGTSIVHWIRRFPFFCSDREYTIARRIWELEGSFYCVTKGVPCPTVPRKQKPRRVDNYYSSWFIRSVKSKKGNNHRACEVTFFHHEDMGIPWEIAKFGVGQGMWGTAKKIEQGLRWYEQERARSRTISDHQFMAQLNTKINQNYLTHLESADEQTGQIEMMVKHEKESGMNMPKLLVIGGAVILACSLNRGFLTKAVVFGVARRLGNLGRRAFPPR